MERLTTDDYRRQLATLQPPGAAFPDDQNSTWQLLLAGLAEEYARGDGRTADLFLESNPESTTEMLADWERLLALPSPCNTVAGTLQQRRRAAHSKLTSAGGQTPAFYIAVAEALGYEVEITEYRPFRAGFSDAGGSLTNETWLHQWMVNAAETAIFEFIAGQSLAGEPVRNWSEDQLECPIEQLKPAHTNVTFSYGV